MNFKSSFLYAKKITFPHKGLNSRGTKSLFGAMLCIGISLIPLVSILTVSDGMVEGITKRLIELSSRDLQISFENGCDETLSYEAFSEVSQLFRNYEGVTDVYPEINCSALAAGKNYRSGAFVRAVEKDVFERSEGYSRYFNFVQGEADLSRLNNCIIGQHLSEVLDLKVNDSIKIITVNSKGKNPVPKVSVYKVKGIVSCGYQELDALWVFIPIESGFKNLSLTSAEFITGISTDRTFDEQKLFKLQFDIQKFLFSKDGIDNCYVKRWDEVNRFQFENFASTKALLLLIVFIIVLVASINISSAIVMIVMERKKEIAILKSTGASASGITLSFLLTGFFCGCGGVIFGLPLGLLVSVNINPIISGIEKITNFFVNIFNLIFYGKDAVINQIHILNPEYYLQEIPVSIPVKELIIVTVFTLLLSIIMASIPSIKAGKEKPISTLRKM